MIEEGASVIEPPNRNTLKDLFADDCGNCRKCLDGVIDSQSGFPILNMMMIVCPICGNKRCPKATDHDLLCTNSNESGQKGSVYQ